MTLKWTRHVPLRSVYIYMTWVFLLLFKNYDTFNIFHLLSSFKIIFRPFQTPHCTFSNIRFFSYRTFKSNYYHFLISSHILKLSFQGALNNGFIVLLTTFDRRLLNIFSIFLKCSPVYSLYSNEIIPRWHAPIHYSKTINFYFQVSSSFLQICRYEIQDNHSYYFQILKCQHFPTKIKKTYQSFFFILIFN